MPATAFIDKLNEQIGNEFAAHQQYVAIAVHFQDQTLPRLQAFFYRQALEERDHAMMMIQYQLDHDILPVVPGVVAPKTGFADVVEPIALALRQEQQVSEQIRALAGIARNAEDYQSAQFMDWFLKEQVEEVSTMSDLLKTAERSRDNALWIEEFIARESFGGEATDPTAPPVAGEAG